MLFETRKQLEFFMTQVAFVFPTIPGLISREVFDPGGGIGIGIGEEAGRISDDIVSVESTDVAVDGITVDTRGTCTRLMV
jgi:hypothetical protein